MTVITEREEEQISKANASGLAPVVFVHGLWLLPSSWDRWAKMFEKEGFEAVAVCGGARSARVKNLGAQGCHVLMRKTI